MSDGDERHEMLNDDGTTAGRQSEQAAESTKEQTGAERASSRKQTVRSKIESGSTLSYDEVKCEPWSMNDYNNWTPGTSPTDLPPVAVAALADAIAQTGNSPKLIVADLRLELQDLVANGKADEHAVERREADLVRLEAELVGQAMPAGKCCKCRVQPRAANMVHCGHQTLCVACEEQARAHCGQGSTTRAAKLARLMCPVCRGFELEPGASADDTFAIIDTNCSGSIEIKDLWLHLLVAGQESDAVTELFRDLDLDEDGVVSKDEWRAGYARFLSLAHPELGDHGSVAPPAPESEPPKA